MASSHLISNNVASVHQPILPSPSNGVAMACAADLREEFRPKCLLFDHPNVQHFGRFQWWESTTLFVVYRAGMFAYYFTWLVLAGFAETGVKDNPGIFFVYLTNVSFVMLTLYMLYAFILSLVLHFEGRRGPLRSQQPMPLFVKASWVLHVIVADAAIFVSIAYWSILYEPDSDFPFDVDFHLHGVNTIGVVLDLLLSHVPVRLLHFWLGQCFGAAYILMTVVFWACGGVVLGKPYIYPILDYSGNPDLAALIIALSILLGMPIVHLLLFSLHKTRQAIHRRTSARKEGMHTVTPGPAMNLAFVP